MAEEKVYPICDKCGKQHKDVVCYEGFAVGIRLCKDVCDKEYLAKMKTKNEEYTETENSWTASKVILLNAKGDPEMSETQQDALNLVKSTERAKVKEELVAFKNTVKGV